MDEIPSNNSKSFELEYTEISNNITETFDVIRQKIVKRHTKYHSETATLSEHSELPTKYGQVTDVHLKDTMDEHDLKELTSSLARKEVVTNSHIKTKLKPIFQDKDVIFFSF